MATVTNTVAFSGRLAAECSDSEAGRRLPTWPHSKRWGYASSGVLGLVVAIIIVLLLMERL